MTEKADCDKHACFTFICFNRLRISTSFSAIYCHGNINYNEGNFQQKTENERTINNDHYQFPTIDVSNRFGVGFTSQQLAQDSLIRGQYANSKKSNVQNYPSSDDGFWNSYDGAHTIKKRLALPNVSYIQKQPPLDVAVQENHHLKSVLIGLDQGTTNVHGDVKIVDKYKSRLGKLIITNEQLTKTLHEIKHGGDSLVVHGDVLDTRSHPIGKAIKENQRLGDRLTDIYNDADSLLVKGSVNKAIKQVKSANIALRRQIAQAKKEQNRAKAQIQRQIRQDNAEIRKDIIRARKQKTQQPPVILENDGSVVSISHSGSIQNTANSNPVVVDHNNPIGVALAENQRLRSHITSLDAANSAGAVTVVDKYKSNIGKGLIENERLLRQLNDILYGGDTLVVHGEVLDIRKHPIGKGLSENDKLNQMLQDIKTGQDKIVIQGSPQKLMNEIRKANAELRQKVIKAKRDKQRQKANTLKEIKRDSTKLRNAIKKNS